MKVVKFKAGFGNQLFQFAFAEYLRVIKGYSEIYIDYSWVRKWYSKKSQDFVEVSFIERMNVDLNIGNTKKILRTFYYNPFHPRSKKYKLVLALHHYLNPFYYFEKSRSYKEKLNTKRILYFDGYWQTYKYLEPIRELLLEYFMPKREFQVKVSDEVRQLEDSNSVFIGVRKGDYVKQEGRFGILDDKYYSVAIQEIKNRIDNPVFYVFSDDINWVKANMFKSESVIYLNDNNTYNDYEEFQLMSLCKHAIIPNSTFHWWAAWLIKNKNKLVVAPKNWFNDGTKIEIIPPKWIRL